ncbi:MAG: FAD-binding oxidoreductase [Candidatus Thermoplasmatota archaeon]
MDIEVISEELSRIVDTKKIRRIKGKVVVYPKDKEDVINIMRFASSNKIKVGIILGDEEKKCELLIHLGKMKEVISIDEKKMVAQVSVSVNWERLIEELNKKSFMLGSHPYNINEPIGLWLANGGSGIGSYKHGTAYSQVRSLSVVLANGSVIESGVKELSNYATGINFNGLFVGSGNKFGAIVSASLKIYPKIDEILHLSYSFEDFEKIDNAIKSIVNFWIEFYNVSFSIENSFVLDISLEGKNYEKDVDELIEKIGGKKIDTKKMNYPKNPFNYALPLSSLKELWKYINDKKIAITLFGNVVDRRSVELSFYSENIEKEELAKFFHTIGGGVLELEERVSASMGNLKNLYKTIESIKSSFDPENIIEASEFYAIGSIPRSIENSRSSHRENFQEGIDSSTKIEESKSNFYGFDEKMKNELKEIFGDNVTTDEFERSFYTHDLAPLPRELEFAFKSMPDAVIRPKNSLEVIKAMRFAKKYKLPIIPRGGASWGFGGCVPTNGGIVIDLTGMKRILEIDEENMKVICEPGVSWEELIKAVEKKNYCIGAHPSSAPVATIGGWLSTGGGGGCSYKYGIAFDQVISLEVVLPNCEVIETERLSHIYHSPNINSIFIGAEGTTGIITKIELKLSPKHEIIKPFAFSFKGMEAIQKPIEVIARTKTVPLHISILDGKHFYYLRKIGKSNLDVGAMLCIVLCGSKKEVENDEKVLKVIIEEYGGKDEGLEIAKHEWEERFYDYRASKLGPGFAMGEGVIPLHSLAEMSKRAKRIMKEMKMEASIIGICIDRTTVAFISYFLMDSRSAIGSMFSMGYVKKIIKAAIELGGRAPGLGVWFASNLKKWYGSCGVEVVSRLRKIIDPDDIMNPGKFTEIGTRYGFKIPSSIFDKMLDIMAFSKKALPADRINLGGE